MVVDAALDKDRHYIVPYNDITIDIEPLQAILIVKVYKDQVKG